MERISVAGPWITRKEIDYVADAAANAWFDNANIYHERFEKAFAGYMGVQYAVALPSCTSAIHLSLLSLGIGPMDEVIVPDITWIATAAPVTYVGATPVFADIDPETWCLDAKSFAKCITPKTRAVIPVDLYGNMPEWDDILKVARQHNIAVIEDAAQAIGSEYHKRKAGAFGDTGVFSFHGSKTLTTGEGGMLVTQREDIFSRVLQLRDHGRKPGDVSFINFEVAFKYKMSSMQAAMGLAQLERIGELLERKIQIFKWYESRLNTISEVVLNCEFSHIKNTYWMVTIILDEKFNQKKEKMIKQLSEKGVACRPFFSPLSSLPAYQNLDKEVKRAQKNNPVAYNISPYGINLPSGLNMTEEKADYVCDCLKTILGLN